MHLQTHLALSWATGSWLGDRRDRVLVTWAGVLPDLDALSALGGVDAYGRWHHVATHGILAAAVTTTLAAVAAKDRGRTAVCAFAAFHLHLFCDLVGSGTGWSIAYLFPWSLWRIQGFDLWELASWQNLLVTLVAVGYSCWTGLRWNRSFLEAFLPRRFDEVFCRLLRRWRSRLSAAEPDRKAP